MKNKINNIVTSKVFKNGVWLTILQLVNTVIPIITIPYITRILGAEEYGVFSIALNWILYLQVLVEFGFGLSGARKVALIKENEKEKLNNIFNNIISARLILLSISIVILSIICLISNFNIKTCLCLAILFTMVIGTTFQLTWLFQGKQNMKFITIINVIARIISILLTFIFIKKQNHIYLYCFLYAITILISSAISMFVASREYGLKFKFSKFKFILEEIKDGIYIFASSAMTKIFSGLGITILGIITNDYITGIYSAIYKIPYILTMFFSPISQAIYPYASNKYKDGYSEGVRSVKKIFSPIFVIFLILSSIIIIFNKHLIQLMFGIEYSKYSIIVIPLVIQFLFAVINNFMGIQILVASGKQKEYTQAFTIGCIGNIVSNLVLGNLFGIYGISIAAATGEALLTCSLLIKLKKERSNRND